MKIIGFTYVDGHPEMVLKGDSCLLVNRKPFFKPDWTNDVRMNRCVVLRVSRLGKGIAAKFAERYYDAIAPGADFVAWDILEQAQRNGESWTKATCFDYSLAVGGWEESAEMAVSPNAESRELVVPIAEAVEQASKVMTIRQGDLIYIHYREAARRVERDEVIEEENLYCKIK
jgi:2-keto-4-pentenoate hydratase/2-oxohepta-3-ene-1,7-dioic acid hydratase in catechol pathway